MQMASSEEQRNGWPIQVYLYDLSHGMAGNLSQQFIGKRLECIPHTGLIVYGYEYFFGGGIQSARPGTTIAGAPWKKYTIGFTTVTQPMFHNWCLEKAARFSPANYDLLTHNCNNFTEEASQFLTGKSIPKFITELPEDALSCPMGAMLRPMIENMMNQVQNTGMIPGMNNPVVRPMLPAISMGLSAPIIRSEARDAVRQFDAQEAERNERRRQEKLREQQQNQNNPNNPGMNPQANPLAAFMQSMNQQQNVGAMPQQQPASRAAAPVEVQASNSNFKVFNPNPKPFLTLDKNQAKALDNYEKRLLKQLGNNAQATALINEITRVCKTESERLSNSHFKFMTKLATSLPPNKLLSILSMFRYMCKRPEAAEYFSGRQEDLHTLLDRVGLGSSESAPAKDFILVLVNVCLAHLYNNSFPISEKTIDVGLSCIDKFSNTVSLSASRLLFNMTIQMDKTMDDEQCAISSALLEKLTDIKHIGTMRRCVWILSYLLYHVDDIRDLATAVEFDASALKAIEGIEQKDLNLIDDLVLIMAME